MPETYEKNKFDLAGFAVGLVEKKNLLTKDKVKENDIILAVPSSGLHSNGYSLVNHILKKKKNYYLSKKIKKELIKKGIYNLKHGNYEYPITYQLIKDGKKNKVLNKKIKSNISICMIHGKKDEVVPVIYSRKILKLFNKSKKKLIVIKNGDHSLSNKKNLNKIIYELNKIVNTSLQHR